MNHFIKNKVLSGFELINSNPCIHSSNDLNPVWRLMFRTELLKNNNIKFNEEITIGEDFVFNLNAFLKAEKVMAISYAGYMYNIGRQDSLTRNEFKISYETSLEKQYNFRKNTYGFDKQYEYDLYNYYLKVIYWSMIRNIINSGRICYKDIKRINNYEFIKDSKTFVKFNYKAKSLKEYILYLLIYFNCYHIMSYFVKKKIKGEHRNA